MTDRAFLGEFEQMVLAAALRLGDGAYGAAVSAPARAILTVIDGVLLGPLPYPDSHRLVVIEHDLPGFEMPGGGVARFGGQYAQLAHYLDRSRAFDELGGFAAFDAAISGVTTPQYLRMAAALRLSAGDRRLQAV